jgi:hypothetical protein
MRKPFDINAAIPAAWKLIWEHRRKMQAEEGSGFRDNNMHCTASDVENQVRQFAIDDAEGKPRGTMAWGRPTSWPPVRIHCARGTLQGVVRDWLLNEVRQGRIDSHNFGRHHISGMRFRPHGCAAVNGRDEDHCQERGAAQARCQASPVPLLEERRGGPPIVHAAHQARVQFEGLDYQQGREGDVQALPELAEDHEGRRNNGSIGG